VWGLGFQRVDQPVKRQAEGIVAVVHADTTKHLHTVPAAELHHHRRRIGYVRQKRDTAPLRLPVPRGIAAFDGNPHMMHQPALPAGRLLSGREYLYVLEAVHAVTRTHCMSVRSVSAPA